MSKQLRITRWVVDDLRAGTRWYDRISIELGNRFRAAVNAGLDAIEGAPELHPFSFSDHNVRFYRLSRFPYLIHYRIEGKAIVVFGVRHSARDPEVIRRRASGER